MLYVALILIVLASIGLALYALINKNELVTQVSTLQREIEEQDATYSVELERLSAELAKFEKLPRGRSVSHIVRPFVYHTEVAQLAMSLENRTGGTASWTTSLASVA